MNYSEFVDGALVKVERGVGNLTAHEVVAVTGLKARALSERAKRGTFPQPVYLSPTFRVWKAHDVAAWLDAQ